MHCAHLSRFEIRNENVFAALLTIFSLSWVVNIYFTSHRPPWLGRSYLCSYLWFKSLPGSGFPQRAWEMGQTLSSTLALYWILFFLEILNGSYNRWLIRACLIWHRDPVHFPLFPPQRNLSPLCLYFPHLWFCTFLMNVWNRLDCGLLEGIGQDVFLYLYVWCWARHVIELTNNYWVRKLVY